MSQGQGPQTQIGGSVRNGTEHIFNGVNSLVNINFAHGLIIMTVGTTFLTLRGSWQLSFTFVKFHIASQFTIVLRL